MAQIESEAASADKYVAFCVNKYKQFAFNMKIFMDDESIDESTFVENVVVPNGQFKNNTFWGHHFEDKTGKFNPHGFCLLIDSENKILQMGTFKNGKEFGQQRVI